MLNIVLAGEPSLIEELWEYFVDKYFSPELPYMENISFGTGTLLSLRWIIIGIDIGIIFAAACSFYNKRYIGNFIRKLIKTETLDIEHAKTLGELGELKSYGIRHAISSRGTLTRWVRCVEEDEYRKMMEKKRAEFDEAHKNDKKPPRFVAKDFVRDTKTMHFYLPEEMKYSADVKFDAKGTSVGALILVIVCAVVGAGFMSYVLPDMMKMLDNFITVMNNG